MQALKAATSLEVDHRGGGPGLPVGPAGTAVVTRAIPTMVRGHGWDGPGA